MAPPQHGPRFDEFPARAHDPHGAQQDEGYGASPAAQPAKDTYGDGRQPVAGAGKHGEHYDDFGWTQVPALHGQNFDTDFSQPATLDGVEHGSWYDVFRGDQSVDIKYIYGGRDYEGTVIDCGDGEVTVLTYGENQGGGRHVIGLGQMKEMRRMTRLGGPAEDRHPTATAGYTPAPQRASTAEAPSAHDATARGGGRASLDTTNIGTKFANKTDAEILADLRKVAEED